MYLTLLALNPGVRAVQRDLANRHDLHRTVMSLFPTVKGSEPRAVGQVLYRCDLRPDGPLLLLQSASAPDISPLASTYLSRPAESKKLGPFLASIRQGEVLRFRLEANATKRDARTGKRVELRGEQAQLAWLDRQASRHGFRLVRTAIGVGDVRTAAAARILGWKRGAVDGTRQTLTFGAPIFEGLLRVVEPGRLVDAVGSGIGPAKAFGFGMLSLARPPQE